MPDIKSALQAALLRAPVAAVLNQTLKEWDDDEKGAKPSFPINISSVAVQTNPVQTPMQTQTKTSTHFRVSNNVMRETFQCIKDNPGLRNKDIMEIMIGKGFKPSSVTSIPSQLFHTKQVERRDSEGRKGARYYAIVDEYQPMGQTDKKKMAVLKKKVEALRKVAKSKGIADLPAQKPTPKAEGIAALAAPVAQATPEEPKAKRFAMLTTPQSPQELLKHMTAYQARELYDHLKQLFGG
jgi:hypothetical protein